MKLAITILTLLIEQLLVVSSGAESIQVSFLNDDVSRESTLKTLRKAGCPESEIDVLERAITHYYNTPFKYDTSAFPERKDGFYTFASATDFVAALSTNRLSHTEHTFEYNCLDTALLIAGHEMITTANFTAITGPYLAVTSHTNGSEWLVPVASLQDVYNTMYPEWYRDLRDSISERAQPHKQKTIAASLYQFHTLPLGTDETSMRESLIQVLQSNWARCGIEFPSNVLVVILHRARTDYHLAVSDHLGVLIKTGKSYLYLEKTGGQGPFLRIDTDSIEDIATYYATMISPDYPHNYMTINNDVVMEVKKSPNHGVVRTGDPRPARQSAHPCRSAEDK